MDKLSGFLISFDMPFITTCINRLICQSQCLRALVARYLGSYDVGREKAMKESGVIRLTRKEGFSPMEEKDHGS